MEPRARLAALALPPPSLGAFSSAQVAFAAAAWPMRAAEVLRSARTFRALARAAAPFVDAAIARALRAAVDDELFHARLCAAVGARLGAARPAHDATGVRARVAALTSPRRRAAALFLVETAMGETISTSLFRRGRRAAVEPLTRAALGAIVRDEIRHARLGWSGLRALAATDEDRAFLQEEATRGLGALEQQVALPALRRLEAGEPFDPAYAALGVLPPESRVEAFYETVERLVLPRLDRLGLDGARAWADRYRG